MTFIRRQVIPTTIALCLLLTSFNISRDFFTKDYDTDLDHHMYFGQRLLNGELIWTYEIYDKFPIIQYLFAVPAYFQSLQIWYGMSIIMLSTSVITIYHAGPRLVPLPERITSPASHHLYCLLCASFYAYLSTATQPGLAHINLFTTSCLALAICLAVFSIEEIDAARYVRAVILGIGSATFASCAISIRPFLGAPAVLLLAWVAIRRELIRGQESDLSSYTKLFHVVNSSCRKIFPAYTAWIILTVLLFLITNFFPYIYTNNLHAIVNGIVHNSQKLNPQSPESILFEQFKTLIRPAQVFYLVCLLSNCIIVFTFFWERRAKEISYRSNYGNTYPDTYVSTSTMFDTILGAVIPIASLQAIVLSRHWWDHYWQMYVLLGVVNFMVIVILILRQLPELIEIAVRGVRVVWVCAIAVGAVLGMNANQEAYHPQQRKYEEIVRFLEQRRALDLPVDFIDIGDMYPHWKLHESRRGFPHAQNTQHIVLGWYTSLNRMTHIQFPYTREELCQQVISRGPHVVFMTFSYMFSCLLAKESMYTLERNSWELIIFVRNIQA
jgi:hypothetical protein